MLRHLEHRGRLLLLGRAQLEHDLRGLDELVEILVLRLTRRLAMHVHDLVAANLTEPGDKRRRATKAVETAHRLDQRGLHDVFDDCRRQPRATRRKRCEALGIRSEETDRNARSSPASMRWTSSRSSSYTVRVTPGARRASMTVRRSLGGKASRGSFPPLGV
jgi:hypothetical protein